MQKRQAKTTSAPQGTFLPLPVQCCRAQHFLLLNKSQLCLCKTSSFPRLFIETLLPSSYLPFLLRWLFGSLSQHGRTQEELRTSINCGITQSGNQIAGPCFSFLWISHEVGDRSFPVSSHPCLLHSLLAVCQISKSITDPPRHIIFFLIPNLTSTMIW